MRPLRLRLSILPQMDSLTYTFPFVPNLYVTWEQGVEQGPRTPKGDSTMPERQHLVIPATEGAAFVVRRGEIVKVIDVEGPPDRRFHLFQLAPTAGEAFHG